MINKTFQGYYCDLKIILEQIKTYLIGRGFKVSNFFKQETYLIQARKRDSFTNECAFIKLKGVPNNFQVSIGKSNCINDIRNLGALNEFSFSDKILLGEVRFDNDLWTFIETEAELKRNTAELQKRTISSPQYQIMKETTREIEVIYCQYCRTKNNARLAKCQNCNASLH